MVCGNTCHWPGAHCVDQVGPKLKCQPIWRTARIEGSCHSARLNPVHFSVFVCLWQRDYTCLLSFCHITMLLQFSGLFLVYGCFGYMYVCVSYVCLASTEAIRGHGSSGTGNIVSCEHSCVCRALNLDPLEEQPGLWTTEPSLQPHVNYWKKVLSFSFPFK